MSAIYGEDGFELLELMQAAVTTQVFSNKLPEQKYHYVVNVPLEQTTLFSSSRYYDAIPEDTPSVDMVVDAGLNVTLATILASHNTAEVTEGISNGQYISEWSEIDGSGVNPTFTGLYTDGYHADTVSEFSVGPFDGVDRTLGRCILEIVAKALFNHPGSTAAIANDGDYKDLSILDTLNGDAPLADSLADQLRAIMENEKFSIFEQYVQAYPRALLY